jgi:hypothetical protein
MTLRRRRNWNDWARNRGRSPSLGSVFEAWSLRLDLPLSCRLESPTPGVSLYLPVYTCMYRLIRCYFTTRYILSLKSTYWFILVCTFREKYIPVHTSMYHNPNRYITILIHGGSAALVHSAVCRSTWCIPGHGYSLLVLSSTQPSVKRLVH